ncbi:MAG: hypothetical protein WC932_00920 [archaeon]|jgi:hypothetical protein
MSPKLFKPIFGRRKKGFVNEMIKDPAKDIWIHDGSVRRYTEVFDGRLDHHPIEFLKRKNIKNPKVLFIGPAQGEYISEFKKDMNKWGINPVIEVIGIHKTVKPELIEKQIIFKDHSQGLVLEDIFDNSKKYNSVIKEISNNFDLVIASKSSGVHTLYPAYNVFISAIFLKPRGRTYIEIPSKERVLGIESRKARNQKKFGMLSKLKQLVTGEEDTTNHIPFKDKKRMINEIENIEKEARKYLDKYFKRDTSEEFTITPFFKSKDAASMFIMIDRK